MQPAPLLISDDVAAFRHFNRTYTRLIGTLDEKLLQTKYSLSEARVLYELANRERPTAKEIAAALDMDAGYMSRTISKFEQAGLIKRKTSAEDSRFSELHITRKGRAEFAKLNDNSEKHAAAMLENISHPQRRELIGAMKTIENIMLPHEASSQAFMLRPPYPGDMGLVVQREANVYATEYGWDGTFEHLVLGIVIDFTRNFNPKRECCWIAERNRQHAGHVFLTQHPDDQDTARIRLLMVEREARGAGIGHALVNECIRFARACGYRRITLWTQSILTAAHHIYNKAGFKLIRQEPHQSFGKNLVGQTWELML
ncbi:MAG TPA: helix-turn-helix domain-containing GNAT family N-acetyltransferase [Rickettsiales bacterium]|nr:helix-turn-helix domain-containing GNAT family N-acetyltransferase [Rickettsiales bacterium]